MTADILFFLFDFQFLLIYSLLVFHANPFSVGHSLSMSIISYVVVIETILIDAQRKAERTLTPLHVGIVHYLELHPSRHHVGESGLRAKLHKEHHPQHGLYAGVLDVF